MIRVLKTACEEVYLTKVAYDALSWQAALYSTRE
jgi:hypothetical protein